jgi:hypothetical protein
MIEILLSTIIVITAALPIVIHLLKPPKFDYKTRMLQDELRHLTKPRR